MVYYEMVKWVKWLLHSRSFMYFCIAVVPCDDEINVIIITVFAQSVCVTLRNQKIYQTIHPYTDASLQTKNNTTGNVCVRKQS